jgi:flagellar motor switch/type III secretory pathway protein FliN
MSIHHTWIKQLQEAVEATIDTPVWGKTPIFPLEYFKNELKAHFQLSNLDIEIVSADWKNAEDVLKQCGHQPQIIGIECAPVKTPCYLVMPKEEIAMMTSWLIAPDAPKGGFHDLDLQRGFFRFFLLDTLLLLKNLNLYEGISIRLSDEPLIPSKSYVVDIAIKNAPLQVIARLILPGHFQKEFHHHFENVKIPLEKRINVDELFLNFSISCGTIHQTAHALKKARSGDVLLLTHSSYQPQSKKGYFKLQLGNKPLFQVKVKEDHLKILDYILLNEESPMDQDNENAFDDEISEELDSAIDEDLGLREQDNQESLVDPNHVKLTLVVEIGRFDMTLNQLLELKPGSSLPFSKRPEEGVVLRLNDKKIAEGELIQIGDLIGVKINKTL